jgi:hypothetical protein
LDEVRRAGLDYAGDADVLFDYVLHQRVVSSSTLVNLERTSDWNVREAAGVHLLDTYYIAL